MRSLEIVVLAFATIALAVPTTAATSTTPAKSIPPTPFTPPTTKMVVEIQKRASEIEGFLERKPSDERKREEALIFYSRDESWDIERLKYHTLEMIKCHPSNEHIAWQNSSAFYIDRQYALDVISRLEYQIGKGQAERGVYWLVAYMADRMAVPPLLKDELQKETFFRYYGLPETTTIPSEPDKALAEKSIRYYKLAIEATHKDGFYAPFYANQLARLLKDLDRWDDALAVYQSVLPVTNEIVRADFLLGYGSCLNKLGRSNAAKMVLKKVRECDRGSFEPGTDFTTTRAENLLGEIAVDAGNAQEASMYLLSSCKVDRRGENALQVVPLKLARRLIEKGQYDAVIKYCRTILSKFAPSDKRTQAVLESALAAKRSKSSH